MTWNIQGKSGFMGSILGTPFYSCCHMPGNDSSLSLPFDENPFNCLINASVHISDDAFKEVAERLLSSRMRYAVCAGLESERLSDIINELLENGDYHEDGRTAVCTYYEDEPIEEVMEYFALPCDIAPVNLILNLGSERMFQTSLGIFDSVVKRMKLSLSC